MRSLTVGLWLALVATGTHAEIIESNGQLRISTANRDWSLWMPKGNWQVQVDRSRSDGALGFYQFQDATTHTLLSIYIDQSSQCNSPDSCRALSLKNASYKGAKQLKRFAHPPFEAAQFWLDRPGGLPIQQTHVIAAGYRDNTWLDIHLSQTGMKAPDATELLKFLDQITLK